MSELTVALLPWYNAALTGTRPFLAVWHFSAALNFWHNRHHYRLRGVPNPRQWLSVVLSWKEYGSNLQQVRRGYGVAAML